MRVATVLLAGLAAVSLTSFAAAQQRVEVIVHRQPESYGGVQKIRVAKTTIGDTRIVLWGGASIDPDCSEHPGYSLSVVEPPQHGEVKVVAEPMYVSFPAGNPRAACNSHKIPGRRAYYVAAPGYSGHDRVVLEGFTEDGTMRHVTVDVDVRKPAG